MTPAPAGSLGGNRVTAERWAHILTGLGHKVRLEEQWSGGRCDLLIALHARRSAPSVERFGRRLFRKPIVIGLAGTDVYRDIHQDPVARQTLGAAWRFVVLQPEAIRELPEGLRSKARVIHQSAEAPTRGPKPRADRFEVCVLGHLRAVKDPFVVAKATRMLPPSSRIRVVHLGAALEPGTAERARAESRANPRYDWRGAVARDKAAALLARSRLLVHPSRMEGGANVISEAIAAGVPVLASRIPGSVGILGRDHPGYFPTGDASRLARMLYQAETDPAVYRNLRGRCRALRALVSPAREREAWRALLSELGR